MIWCLLVFSLFICVSAHSYEDKEQTISDLYQRCLALQVEQNPQLSQITALTRQAKTLEARYPEIAECLALQGMIQAQEPSLAKGLEGLNLAKQAKDKLQRALSIDPYVFYGVAYAELGWLYHRTPGWPFSFGSVKMAKHLFNKTLQVNPRSIAVNFRYAEYWFDKENYDQAETFSHITLEAIKLHSPTEPYNQAWSEYKKQLTDQMLTKIYNKNSYLNSLDLSN